MKTNEQIACNNWEKIGYLKGKSETLKKVNELIDKEIMEEKLVIKDKVIRLNWGIVEELKFIKMRIKEINE